MACIDQYRGGGADARISRTALAVALLAAGAAMMGCVPAGSDGEEPAATGLSNPAAAFCVDCGGTYEIRRAADGSQSGVCILANGTEVDAWEYFRKEATPE
jgi:putative hemolysin